MKLPPDPLEGVERISVVGYPPLTNAEATIQRLEAQVAALAGIVEQGVDLIDYELPYLPTAIGPNQVERQRAFTDWASRARRVLADTAEPKP